MREAIGFQLKRPDDFHRYVAATFRALWVDQRNLGGEAVTGGSP
jgi:2-hydroxychromene-2-carboxylate isomerase